MTRIKSPYLQTSRDFPEDFELLEPVLTKMYTEVSQAVNIRIIGNFDKAEVVTGEQWLNPTDPQKKRQSYRRVYSGGAIAPGANDTQPHNISGLTTFTRMWGTCITAAPDYRPIPYASVAANANIDLRADATNYILANGAGAPAIVSYIIVLEYLLN